MRIFAKLGHVLSVEKKGVRSKIQLLNSYRKTPGGRDELAEPE